MDSSSLQELSNFIFASKYSRHIDGKNRRETWHEAVKRVENMHLRKFKNLSEEDVDKLKKVFDLVRDKRVVPSMRSMQFGGRAVEAHNARIFNCAVRHIDSVRAFAEVFYLLLCGCGVGIGLHKHFLDRIPDLVSAKDKTGTIITYVIEDTIEGWSDAVEALLMCYTKNNALTGKKIVFDFSRIRKEGSPLKTGGGKAPGHKGLKNTLYKIKKHLDHIIEHRKQDRFRSIDVYDILMHEADAVLSGGVRRSATSVVFSPDDQDMIEAKTMIKVDKTYAFSHVSDRVVGGKTKKVYEGKVVYDGIKHEVEIEDWELESIKKDNLISWRRIFPQRGRSNNSVLILRDKTSKEEFAAIVERTKQFGEPGFVFADHEYMMYNPCFEIGFIPVTVDGVCGVQFCNLSSLNGALIKTKKEFLECAEAAAIIGTLQTAYTDFPYLSHAAKTLTEDEALLGVSITGMMDNPDILLNKEYQREAAEKVVRTNRIWAKKIGVKQAARTTCLKPEGTSSTVLMSGSGIHAHKHRRYFRRVQCNKGDTIYQFFKLFNDHACEESVWSENNTDDVISFPIEVDEGAMIQDDLTALKHLRIIKRTQQNWVVPGTTEANSKPIHHNVSCTINVQDKEWEEVIEYIYKNKDSFAAISMLPDFGDEVVYQQAPWESVKTEEQQKRFDELSANFSHVPYTKLEEGQDNTNMTAESACSGGKCEVVSV
jgi:ribonucleoside-triphosphate reductase (thioredoxin)